MKKKTNIDGTNFSKVDLKNLSKGNLYSILTVGLVLLAIFGISSCTERIDAGHEGLLVKMYGSDKGVQDVILVTGRVWYNPMTEQVHEIPTYVQTIDYAAFSVNAQDGSVFTVDPTISLKVIDGESPKIFKKYRRSIGEILQITLYNHIKDVYRIEFNKYTTDSIISRREDFENGVQTKMNAFLQAEGFSLEQLTSGIQYPSVITEAINAKNAAVQQAQRVENELKIAEANAKILLVQAEAEAKANELRKASLNPLLIQQQFIEKWDGRTAIYGNAPAFFKSVQ